MIPSDRGTGVLNRSSRPTRPRPSTTRAAALAILVTLLLAVSWPSVVRLLRLSFEQEHYSHMVLVPAITAFILFMERRTIFAHAATAPRAALALFAAGGLVWWLGRRYPLSPSENDELSITMLAIVTAWVGAFVLCYGPRALRAGYFAVLFPLLMVPIPDALLARVISWILVGSAEVSYLAFDLAGVPVFRNGFVFTLPSVTIEVARECSGIRSSMALLIMTLLGGHFLLKSVAAKVALVLVALPLLVVKNGIRIVTLSLLAVYVDPSFLTGELHRQGGILFFLMALGILGFAVRLLQRAEQSRAHATGLDNAEAKSVAVRTES